MSVIDSFMQEINEELNKVLILIKAKKVNLQSLKELFILFFTAYVNNKAF